MCAVLNGCGHNMDYSKFDGSRLLSFGSQCQDKDMGSKPGYLLVMGTASDADSMAHYGSIIPPIYEHYRGYRLAMGEPPGDATFLAGSLDNLGVMLARFPSLDHVCGFWWSDDYRKAYAVRENAGKFSVVGLPGIDDEPDPLPGSRGYLVAMATPQKPEQWRQFADVLRAGLQNLGATMLADAGPEAIERLEGSMPGSHILVALMPPDQDAKSAWVALSAEFGVLREPAEPINIIALEGLPNDHPERLTEESTGVPR